jgi:hypothetical protein
LSAALKLPSELCGAIKAELLPASSSSGSTPSAAGSTVLAAVAVDGSGFFEMRGLKPGAYVLRLSCDPAAAGGRSCEAWEKPVQVGLIQQAQPQQEERYLPDSSNCASSSVAQHALSVACMPGARCCGGSTRQHISRSCIANVLR